MNWNDLFQVPNIDQQFKAWEINLGNKTHANAVRNSSVSAAAISIDGLLHSALTDPPHWPWSVAQRECTF